MNLEYTPTNKELTEASITIESIQKIVRHYRESRSNFEVTASLVVAAIRECKAVHSVKYRVKSESSLIRKIISKLAQKEWREHHGEITAQNYTKKITDIIGVRAIHLFKDDWLEINQFVKKTWETKEGPVAKVRRGDSTEIYTQANCTIQEHRFGYRSVHYIIQSKPFLENHFVEIQARTIFEEGWSEIDHKVRYKQEPTSIIEEYLSLFNRTAGQADEMGSYITKLSTQLCEMQQSALEHEKKIQGLIELVNELTGDAKKKTQIIDTLKSEVAAKNTAVIGAGLLGLALGSSPNKKGISADNLKIPRPNTPPADK